MARVEQNTTRAYELLGSINLTAEDSLYQDIDRRLQDVNRSIEQAKVLRDQDEEKAKEELLVILERTQKLIVYMGDIDGNRTIALETIVPVVLTSEEQQSELAVATSEITRKTEILTLAIPKVSVGAAEKISFAIDAAAKSTDPGVDVGQSLTLARESLVVLDDALKIVSSEGIDITTVTPVALPPVLEATTTASTTLETEVTPAQ
jgi:hypothetical protein